MAKAEAATDLPGDEGEMILAAIDALNNLNNAAAIRENAKPVHPNDDHGGPDPTRVDESA